MKNRKSLIAWITLIFLSMIWGSSFILMKKGLIYFSSDEVGALRIVITFLVMFPFVLKRIRRISRRQWFYIGLIGIIGSGFPPFLFAEAQTVLDSYMAGILNALTPLFTLLVGILFFGVKTRPVNGIGVVIGLAGATGLIMAQSGGNYGFHFGYASLVILATLCYATNVNMIKHFLEEVDALTITAISFFIIGWPVGLYLVFGTDFISQLSSSPESFKGLLYIAILAVFGTGLALVAFNNLVKIATPLFASSVTYLIPVVALIWGLIDYEMFEPVYFIWIILILAGIFMVNRRSV